MNQSPHTAILLDGRLCAQHWMQAIQKKIKNCKANPYLRVFWVGDHPASAIYIRKKKEACEAVGITCDIVRLPNYSNESDLIQHLHQTNLDERVHAVLVQLPLPASWQVSSCLEAIDPQKDVDGLSAYHAGRLAQGHPDARIPCTPRGIAHLLKTYVTSDFSGMSVVMVGASMIVGRPMAAWFQRAKATVTLCNSQTKNLKHHIQQADIVISATGVQHLIEASWVHRQTAVVDVGIHKDIMGRISGDLNTEDFKRHAGWITPVPGGVGPMTIAGLLANVWDCFDIHQK